MLFFKPVQKPNRITNAHCYSFRPNNAKPQVLCRFYFHMMMGSSLFIMSKTENWRTNKIAQKLNLFRNLVFDFIIKNNDRTENIGISVEPTAKIIFPIVISPILINGCVAIKVNEIIKVSIDINTQNRGWFLKSILCFTSFTQPKMNK